MKLNLRFFVLGLVLVGLLALLGGCQTFTSTVPGVNLPLEKAEYTILGETVAEAKGSVILGIFFTGDNHFGEIGGETFFNIGLGVEKVKQNALYKALQQMPEADGVISPRYDIQATLGFFGNDYVVKVTATGIKLKEGPVAKFN